MRKSFRVSMCGMLALLGFGILQGSVAADLPDWLKKIVSNVEDAEAPESLTDAVTEEPEAEAEAEAEEEPVTAESIRAAFELPPPLSEVAVPSPDDLDEYVKDMDAANVLGKAFFWDMQAGSDGVMACASCHFAAGADPRAINQFGLPHDDASTVVFRGANVKAKTEDWPFHKKTDPTEVSFDPDNVEYDTGEVFGSNGIVRSEFVAAPWPGTDVDQANDVPDPVHNIGGTNTRRVTSRNAPSVINAVFNERNFWDGRANRYFNGVNAFGDQDLTAFVWCSEDGELSQEHILLDFSSLASQAVAPILSDVEMSADGRDFPSLALKLLPARPLKLQRIHEDDSVLGDYANSDGRGFEDSSTTYADLIREAFEDKWWEHEQPLHKNGRYTQMEANFSLFWGLAIQVYLSSLVSDETPFDDFLAGDDDALTEEQLIGMEAFFDDGDCFECHQGSELTQAAVGQIFHDGPDDPELLEFMDMEFVDDAWYDNGFYNIGVRPTPEDLGVGGAGPFGPFSYVRRTINGDELDDEADILPGDRVAVDGSFKVPGLRNVELTAPYMHNGGILTLEEVVEFYARGGDFKNELNRAPDVAGFGFEPASIFVTNHVEDAKASEMAAFLRSMTDERVRHRQAPFDGPSLAYPEGHGQIVSVPFFGVAYAKDIMAEIPAVGAEGMDEAGPTLDDELAEGEEEEEAEEGVTSFDALIGALSPEVEEEEAAEEEAAEEEAVEEEAVEEEAAEEEHAEEEEAGFGGSLEAAKDFDDLIDEFEDLFED